MVAEEWLPAGGLLRVLGREGLTVADDPAAMPGAGAASPVGDAAPVYGGRVAGSGVEPC